MKRLTLLFAGLVGTLSLVWAGVAMAANVRSGDTPTVMSTETVDGTLYSAGNIIKVDGTIKGDLICAGMQLTVTGTVEGDVLCAAQDVSISGHVLGNVRVAGQTVTVSGKVDGSASLVAMSARIAGGASIGRDLSVAAQDTSLDGTIGRDGTVVGRTFAATGAIARNLDVAAPSALALNGSARVGGDFTYLSNNNASVASSAHIIGRTTHNYPPANETKPMQISAQAWIVWAVFGFVSSLITGLALLGLTPRLLAATTDAIASSPLGTIGAGLLGLIVPPILAVALFMTVFGVPLGFVLLLGWIVTLLLGVSITAKAFGEFLILKLRWHDSWHHFAGLVLGLLVIYILSLIPLIGGLVIFASLLWGVGALWFAAVRSRVSTRPTKKQTAKA